MRRWFGNEPACLPRWQTDWWPIEAIKSRLLICYLVPIGLPNDWFRSPSFPDFGVTTFSYGRPGSYEIAPPSVFFFFVNRNRFTFDFYSSPSSFPFPSLPPPPSSSSVFLASSAAYISMAKASISDRWRGRGGDCFTRCSFQNRFAFHGWNCQLIIITYISSYISSHIHIIIYFTYISSYIYFITIYLSIHLESNEMAWQCGVERFPECSALRVACIDSIIIDKISWADIWFIVQLPLLIRNWNRKQNQTKPNCH